MTSPRERMMQAFGFEDPDRIPVLYGNSTPGLFVHGRKLLEFLRLHPADNPVHFDVVPVPPPHTIDADARYRERKRDEWGTEWEYNTFGAEGLPVGYPVSRWSELDTYAFPDAHTDSALLKRDRELLFFEADTYLTFRGEISLVDKLRSMRPFEEVQIALRDSDPHVLEFLDRLTEHWLKVIHYWLEAGADVIVFQDDWGSRSAPLIPQPTFKAFFRSHYRRLFEPIKKAGKRVLLHSQGQLGPLLDEFFKLDIDVLWPQLTICEQIPGFFEKCANHRVSLILQPDKKTLMPLGTPEQINAYVKQLAERFHRLRGGAAFHIQIENDTPFKNARALIEAVYEHGVYPA